jgi:hypothetical protein
LQGVLVGLVLFVITFSVSLGVVSLIIVKLPATYFREDHPRDFWTDKHIGIRAAGVVGKNLLGVILVAGSSRPGNIDDSARRHAA